MTTRAAVESHIRQKFSRQLRACRALRQLAEDLLTSEWLGRPLPEQPDGDWIAAGIFPRAATSYGASIELARCGYGDQAAMLNRSIFKDLVDLGWTILHRDEAVSWLEDHGLYQRMLLADAAASEHGYGESIEVPTFDPHERERLARRFGTHGDRSWNGANVHQKAKQIERLFPEADDLENLRFFRVIVHRQNNGLLHMGASAIDQITLGRGEADLRMRVGPANGHIDQALVGAYWPMFQIVRMAIEHFEIEGLANVRLRRARERFADLKPDPLLERAMDPSRVP